MNNFAVLRKLLSPAYRARYMRVRRLRYCQFRARLYSQLDTDKYYRLMPYIATMLRFWEWDFNKFLSPSTLQTCQAAQLDLIHQRLSTMASFISLLQKDTSRLADSILHTDHSL